MRKLPCICFEQRDFAPVPNEMSVKILIVMILITKWCAHVLDVQQVANVADRVNVVKWTIEQDKSGTTNIHSLAIQKFAPTRKIQI